MKASRIIWAGWFWWMACMPRPAEALLAVRAATNGQAQTTSASFVEIPESRMAFTLSSGGNVTIGFSAEAGVSGGQCFVQALVDGQPAQPSDVMFCSGGEVTRAFNFTVNLGAGSHEVVLRYLATGGTAYLYDRSVWVAAGPEMPVTVAAASGPAVTTASAAYTDIPGLSATVVLSQTGFVVVTMSAEAYAPGTQRVWARALVDGNPAVPGNVVFHQGAISGVRQFTFVAPYLDPGLHTVTMQFAADAAATASLGDRTMSVSAFDFADAPDLEGYVVSRSPASGPWQSTASASFELVPEMSDLIAVPEGGSLAASFCAEAYADAGERLFVRALLNGVPALPSDVLFTPDPFTGVVAFNFARDLLPAGVYQVDIQWSTDGTGKGYVGDRNLTLMAGVPKASPWSNVADQGGGWKHLGWFGWFVDAGGGWIWHQQHDWMYGSGRLTSLWLWTADMGWLWTSDSSYPYLYRLSDGAWLWYKPGSDHPRWFLNLATSGWESR